MRITIPVGTEEYLFTSRSDLLPDETPMMFTDDSAGRLVDAIMGNPATNQSLRHLIDSVSSFSILSKLGNVEVSAQIVRRLLSGEIAVVPISQTTLHGPMWDKEEAEPEQTEPPPDVVATTADEDIHWIKFKLVNEKDQPVQGTKLNLAISGKAVMTHDVDGAFLHLKDLPPGTCDIKSLEVDGVYEVIEFK